MLPKTSQQEEGLMAYETILLDHRERVVHLTLNRPERLNAISPKLLQELSSALDEISRMAQVRVVILAGAGRAFSSGTDLQALAGEGLERLPSAFRYQLKMMQEALTRITTLEKPVLAKVHGYALGAAMELALACDFRISTEDARWGLPEVLYSIVPDLGGTQRLVRLVGVGKAKELVMLGRTIDGAEAQTLGIVNRAVSPERLDEEVHAWVEEILRLPPLGVGLAKKTVDSAADSSIQTSLEFTAQVQGALISSKDFSEAVMAKLQKREPVFVGK
jgi:enoyl-CoA hydratase/3-hydroxyacyl-CoA dehydrogenase